MTRHIRFSIWFSIILLSAFLVGYLSWAKATFNWPFDDTFYPYPERNHNAPQPPLSLRGGEGELDFADWKTYHNEKYGFELKYPLDWDYRYVEHYQNGENYIFEISTDRKDNYIVIAPTTGYAADPPADVSEKVDIQLAGIAAVKYVWPTLTIISLKDPPPNWVEGVGHVYFFSKDPKVSKILSTFKFIK